MFYDTEKQFSPTENGLHGLEGILYGPIFNV